MRWALRRRYVSATGLFARYGERYVSASRAFAAHTSNFIPATTFAMVYSCATSLVSFELIHIKRIEEKETPLSVAIEDMMHKLQVSMGVPLSTNIVTQLPIFKRLFSLKSLITKSAPRYPSTLDYLQ